MKNKKYSYGGLGTFLKIGGILPLLTGLGRVIGNINNHDEVILGSIIAGVGTTISIGGAYLENRFKEKEEERINPLYKKGDYIKLIPKNKKVEDSKGVIVGYLSKITMGENNENKDIYFSIGDKESKHSLKDYNFVRMIKARNYKRKRI